MHRSALATGILISLAAIPAVAADNDPFEPANRAVYNLNKDVLDRYVLTPLVEFHNRAIPRPARVSIRHFFGNLGEPSTFENSILQLHPGDAGRSAGRFLINTTIGVVGFMDIAQAWGLPPHKEDFGQTLGRYGVGEGPYLVVPVIGPAPTRDLAGRVVDGFIDPLSLITFQGSTYVSLGIDAATVVVDRAHDLKDGLQTPQLAQTYELERAEYRTERVAEIANTETQFAEALPSNAATPQAPERVVLASFRSDGDELSKVNAALLSTGITITEVRSSPDGVTYMVQPQPESEGLPCSTIWNDVDVTQLVNGGTVRFTATRQDGPSYVCTKIVSPDTDAELTPLPVVASAGLNH